MISRRIMQKLFGILRRLHRRQNTLTTPDLIEVKKELYEALKMACHRHRNYQDWLDREINQIRQNEKEARNG